MNCFSSYSGGVAPLVDAIDRLAFLRRRHSHVRNIKQSNPSTLPITAPAIVPFAVPESFDVGFCGMEVLNAAAVLAVETMLAVID